MNLPSLPEFEVSKEVDFDFESNKVFFVLMCGVDDVVCSMSGILKVEEFEVSPSLDPQMAVDRDFKFLQVEDTALDVVESDVDIVPGQKLKLTEHQRRDLNEYLKEEMVMV